MRYGLIVLTVVVIVAMARCDYNEYVEWKAAILAQEAEQARLDELQKQKDWQLKQLGIRVRAADKLLSIDKIGVVK